MKIYPKSFIILLIFIALACQPKERSIASNQSAIRQNTLISHDSVPPIVEPEKPKQDESIRTFDISEIDRNKVYLCEEDKNLPLVVAEQMPQFPGGDAAMYKFIGENLKLPKTNTESGLQGRVVIRFLVLKNGKITNAAILRGVEPEYDKAAKQLIESMPDWIPGKQDGKNVDVYYTMPISVHLKR